MRSNTLTPLLQVAEFLHIDPFQFAGIDKTASNNKCACIMQYDWQSTAVNKNQFWSRENFEKSLLLAEDIFLEIKNIYPAPYYIEEEVSFTHSSLLNLANSKKKSIIPSYTRNLSLGQRTLQLIEIVALDKTDVDNIFATITVPLGTLKEDIRIFYTSGDVDYYEQTHPRINDLDLEIRPVRNILISGTTCTITIPAYLLKRPALNELEECAPHVEASYIDNIAVYLEVNSGDAGHFIGTSPCDTDECDEIEKEFCGTTRIVGTEEVIVPSLYNSVSYNIIPTKARIYYKSGYDLKDRKTQNIINNILMYLTVNLAVLGDKECDCKYVYAKSFVEHLTTLKRTLTVETKNSVGDAYDFNSTERQREYIRGFQPTNGTLLAFNMLYTLK